MYTWYSTHAFVPEVGRVDDCFQTSPRNGQAGEENSFACGERRNSQKCVPVFEDNILESGSTAQNSLEILVPSFPVHQETSEQMNCHGYSHISELGQQRNLSQYTVPELAFLQEQDIADEVIHDVMSTILQQRDFPGRNAKYRKRHEKRKSGRKPWKSDRVAGEYPAEMIAKDFKAFRVLCPPGSTDRHCKVFTSKGLRDRRVRLSFETAVKFYDVQHRLGYDQPSKAVDWLIHKSQTAIDELPQISPAPLHMSQCLKSGIRRLSYFPKENTVSSRRINPCIDSSDSVQAFDEETRGSGLCSARSFAERSAMSPQNSKKQSKVDTTVTSIQKYLYAEQQGNSRYLTPKNLGLSRRDYRAKAREKARHRTQEKSITKQCLKSFSQQYLPHVYCSSAETDQIPIENTTPGDSQQKLKRKNSSTIHVNRFASKFDTGQNFYYKDSLNSSFPHPLEDSFFCTNENSSLNYSHTEMQSSPRITVHCHTIQQEGSSIQSTESTIFPLSSSSTVCPGRQLIPDCLLQTTVQVPTPMSTTCYSGSVQSPSLGQTASPVQELQAIEQIPRLNASMESADFKTLFNTSTLSCFLTPISDLQHASYHSCLGSRHPTELESYICELALPNEDFLSQSNLWNVPAKINLFDEFHGELSPT